MRAVQFLVILIGIGGLARWLNLGPDEQVAQAPDEPATSARKHPGAGDLVFQRSGRKVAFEAKCSVCHGINAVGQRDIAPPLVHRIYEPSHHGDEAFQRAEAIGVRRHHWPFGDMPPVEGLTRGDVAMIITCVRELQRANGID